MKHLDCIERLCPYCDDLGNCEFDMATDDPQPANEKLAACLDEEATALMNVITTLQGIQGDRDKMGQATSPRDALHYWQTMARLAQVRGRLIEIRGY